MAPAFHVGWIGPKPRMGLAGGAVAVAALLIRWPWPTPDVPVPGAIPPAPVPAFRMVGDLDGDAFPDTFGYDPEPPWHTVRFGSRTRRWAAQPGEGLEDLFAALNERIRRDIEAREPDLEKQRARYRRYRVSAENIEHGPVLYVGDRLVVMWYMEPMYPAGINTYDIDGRLLSRYIHPGHLRSIVPAEVDGETLLVFGGTNNFVDREPARRAGRASLNLPIVGAIRLGEDGFDPAFVGVTHRPAGPHLRLARPPFYAVVDPARNSQVVRLRSVGDGCVFEADYEPGTTASGWYAATESTIAVDLCAASLGNGSICEPAPAAVLLAGHAMTETVP